MGTHPSMGEICKSLSVCLLTSYKCMFNTSQNKGLKNTVGAAIFHP